MKTKIKTSATKNELIALKVLRKELKENDIYIKYLKDEVIASGKSLNDNWDKEVASWESLIDNCEFFKISIACTMRIIMEKIGLRVELRKRAAERKKMLIEGWFKGNRMTDDAEGKK